MTSLTIEYFEQRERHLNAQREKLAAWCADNKAKPLTSWMHDHGYYSYDLFAAGLISYTESVICSMPKQLKLSTTGRELIGIPPVIDRTFDEDIELYYVLNEDRLAKHLFGLKSRSEREKILDYRREYEEKYGQPPPLPDEEKPLKERSYVIGPFCDLDFAIDVGDRNALSTFFCHWCGLYLRQKPSFNIAKAVLCFSCAKLAHQHLEPVAQVLNDLYKNEADKSQEEHDNWKWNFFAHKRNKGLFTKIAELFHGDRNAYNQQYLDKFPEPNLILYRAVSTDISLVESTYESRHATRKWILARDDNI